MKWTILVAVSFMTITSFPQKVEKFFDYQYHETNPAGARYYSITEKTDSNWKKTDYYIREKQLRMKGSFADSACKTPVGDLYIFHSNGKLATTGAYVMGKKEGLWLSFYKDGTMQDSTVFVNGNPTGTSMHWHRNGFIADSTVWNPNQSCVSVNWFDNGSPASAGRYSAGFTKHGKWVYYHLNGKRSSTEIYNQGTLLERTYFDEQENRTTDTADTDRPATFREGIKGWRKHLDRHLYWPHGYTITNADSVTVVVSGIVDEEGKICDVEVSVPFNPVFDKIALDAVKRSPAWLPALDHNRRVKDHFHQPVTFGSPR